MKGRTEFMSAKYRLLVRNSKAIKSADIELESITVLSGVNASGKSTLARMIHQIVNLSARYPFLLELMAWRPLKSWAAQIAILGERLNRAEMLSLLAVEMASSDFENELGHGQFAKVLEKLDGYTQKVFDLYKEKMSQGDAKRAYAAFVRAVGIGDDYAADLEKTYQVFKSKYAECLNIYNKHLNTRIYDAYNYATTMKYYDIRWLMDAEEVRFSEDAELVYGVHDDKESRKLIPDATLKELFGLKQSFYIASPWVGLPRMHKNGMLTIKYDDFDHYPDPNFANEFEGLSKIIEGSIDSDDSTGEMKWIYHQWNDGKDIDLNDCATGIKALSILNILCKYGYVTPETLLIIDEPEAHLHPQWIVEYAKVLVKLVKHRKVRLLLTSHNPDMVAAIQEISVIERVDGVRFYLAEAASKGEYEYKSLGTNVEPIFKAFNKAIETLDNYESQDGE